MFSEKFLWGVSSSGFQFEMGDREGKWIDPNSDWFVWVHDKENIRKGIVSGDLPEYGVNYWELYKIDHEIAKKMGLNAYRIGIEWSRIFPKSTISVEVGVERDSEGFISKVDISEEDIEKLDQLANKEAIKHYREIVEDLRKREFKVFVCLNHFTIPLWLHDPISVHKTNLRKGPKGWVDEQSIIEFAKYVAYVAYSLGDLVDKWATFNEPMVVTEIGYNESEAGFPPCIKNHNGFKKATLNMVLAHIHAYNAIKKWDDIKADGDSLYPAEVGLIHNIIPSYPLDPDKEDDIKAAEYFNHLHNLMFIEASTTGWFDTNLNGIKEKGETKNYMMNKMDWLGVNYYTRMIFKGKYTLIAKLAAGIPTIPEPVKGYGFSCSPNSVSLANRPTSNIGWEVYPEGLLDALKIVVKYDIPLYITENGVADNEDKIRPQYIVDHLKVLEKAITEEKIRVNGYFHWALTDNYEWAHGFRMKFGLHAVDLSTKKRILRKSAQVIQQIIKNKEIPMKY